MDVFFAAINSLILNFIGLSSYFFIRVAEVLGDARLSLLFVPLFLGWLTWWYKTHKKDERFPYYGSLLALIISIFSSLAAYNDLQPPFIGPDYPPELFIPGYQAAAVIGMLVLGKVFRILIGRKYGYGL